MEHSQKERSENTKQGGLIAANYLKRSAGKRSKVSQI